MTGDDVFDVASFARGFQRFLESINELAGERDESPLRAQAVQHLGADPEQMPTLSEDLDDSDLPNLQLALDAILQETPGWTLLGLPAEARHYGGFSLGSLLTGRMGLHPRPVAPAYVNRPVGVDETLPCVELGLWFLTYEGVPLAVLVSAPDQHGQPTLEIEVMAPDQEAARRFLDRLRAEMHERNVYRGKVLSFSFSEWGRFGISFHRVPPLTRDDVILPDADLAAIEQHTVVISERADALRAAGRHLRRGLLLYGPPGTGKTLSVMYLCNRMPGRTTVLLSGVSAGALGQAVAIARSLQPSTVVLEDVDLVAMERTMPGMGSNPMLFQLLNEMDGLAEDADVLFVLTTNRVELLEPALAARPGRIDQAVEIGLPGPMARRRLVDLYLRGISHSVEPGDELDDVIERTDGVSAAFVKELIRRATILGLEHDRPITAADLQAALTDVLDHSAPVLRSTLGANPDIADAGAIEAGFGPAPFGPAQAVTAIYFEEG